MKIVYSKYHPFIQSNDSKSYSYQYSKFIDFSSSEKIRIKTKLDKDINALSNQINQDRRARQFQNTTNHQAQSNFFIDIDLSSTQNQTEQIKEGRVNQQKDQKTAKKSNLAVFSTIDGSILFTEDDPCLTCSKESMYSNQQQESDLTSEFSQQLIQRKDSISGNQIDEMDFVFKKIKISDYLQQQKHTNK